MSPKTTILGAPLPSNSELSVLQVNRQDPKDALPRGPRKYWEVSTHCESVLLPQRRPDIRFDSPATNWHYQRLAASSIPDQQMGKLITQAHKQVLARQNQSQVQVRNFILPVQLMKMKNMDPLSKQRIIEDLCKHFSSQHSLYNVVLEQAELKFADLCRLLVAIASSCMIKCLYLWNVLDKCDKPFEGPLQSDIILQDLPRIPYTHNPGGRKYLRDLRNKNLEQNGTKTPKKESVVNLCTKPRCKSLMQVEMSEFGTSTLNMLAKTESNDIIVKLEKLENIVMQCLAGCTSDEGMTCKLIKKELEHYRVVHENVEHVFSQAEVGIQCQISQDDLDGIYTRHPSRTRNISLMESRYDGQNVTQLQALKATRLRFCKQYLKYYENAKISFDILRDIYVITLTTFTHLTKLAVNYCMLADGTGEALLSIGSIVKGRLRDLKLLCELDELPSDTHELYNDAALHAIPDLVWHDVKRLCPDLKVHIVCVSMSAYGHTKRFVTKSMPLSTFHMENGFLPNLALPQLTIFCTFKCLWLDHARTLEHVNLTMWHYTGRIDSSLEKLIQNTRLLSFVYHGPLQYISSFNKLCDAALHSSKMIHFKLMIQGDPCFPHVVRELTTKFYKEYKPKFQDKSIRFTLGTFNS